MYFFNKFIVGASTLKAYSCRKGWYAIICHYKNLIMAQNFLLHACCNFFQTLIAKTKSVLEQKQS
jgi:hypothetical protein